ncbi:MAG: AAA family ATPase, partial [Patescibacteria group bacterium]
YEMKKAQTTTEVTLESIRDIVSQWTGIPISKLTESEVEKLARLEEIIHKRMINQEEAVSVVAQAVRRGRAGLKSAGRPIGSFIFLGPTGVGKTELAKTLAEILFGQEEAMIRLDMTEFMEKHEVAKLLGAPPGYVGYEEGGKLTEAVRRKPYSVVLFDEVEKAHPDIFNILLQILDDGRLTDNKGRTISFKNTVIICTSNIGTKLIQDELMKKQSKDKETYIKTKERVMEELRKFFRPELINRFDETTIFEPLTFANVVEVVKLQLKSLEKLMEEQGIGFSYSPAALEAVAKIGYDPVYGARPLRRAIQKNIENPISTLIIEHKLNAGDTAQIDFKNNQFTFDVGKVAYKDNGSSNVKKNMKCKSCQNSFETEVVSNATTICSRCAQAFQTV